MIYKYSIADFIGLYIFNDLFIWHMYAAPTMRDYISETQIPLNSYTFFAT